MHTIITVTIVIHVIAGITALISGALAIILKKQTPKHKRVGRIYFWCMTVIFVTGIFLSVAKGRLFFFYIAIFTYHATLVAYRALRLKNLHKGQKPLLIDWIIEGVAGLAFIGLIVLAVSTYLRSQSANALIPLVFGGIGLRGVILNVRRMVQGPKETLYWLKVHIGSMLGSYIGAITAFLVNQEEHIPVHPVILWLGPTFILVPMIVMELKKVKSTPLVS